MPRHSRAHESARCTPTTNASKVFLTHTQVHSRPSLVFGRCSKIPSGHSTPSMWVRERLHRAEPFTLRPESLMEALPPELKSSSNPSGKILQLFLNCRSGIHRIKIEIEANFALADMECMLWVKISFVAKTGHRRLRTIKLAQFGEQLRRSRWRGINVCSEPELAPLSRIVAIRSLSGVRVRTGSDALFRGIVGLSQGFAYFGRRQQRAKVSGRFLPSPTEPRMSLPAKPQQSTIVYSCEPCRTPSLASKPTTFYSSGSLQSKGDRTSNPRGQRVPSVSGSGRFAERS